MTDTSKEAERVQIELLQKAGFQRRLELTCLLSQNAKKMAMDGIARANPTWTKRQIEIKFIEVHYGKDLAQKFSDYLDGKRDF